MKIKELSGYEKEAIDKGLKIGFAGLQNDR